MFRGRVSGRAARELTDFELVSLAPGSAERPLDVDWTGARKASRAAPVAAILFQAGALDLEHPPALDQQDHWYRTRLPEAVEGREVLVLDGLATLSDAWIDGEHVLTSDSMFVRHELDVTGHAGGELVLRFRALGPELSKRRPRPRWRTRLVEQQQLRFVRTSLLGRTPGFCPSVPVVGLSRPPLLESRARFHVREASVATSVRGQAGVVRARVTLEAIGDVTLAAAELVIEGDAGSARGALTLQREGAQITLAGELTIAEIARWWPHTHGAQPRSQARLVSEDLTLELGAIAFRELALDRGDDGHGFGLVLNGVPVFARGAVWTTDDLVHPGGGDPRVTLERAREAGMNMLRVGGTTSYESARFYELCDELGILVFHDFMFANMDYPASDPAFVASVEREARTLLAEIGARPSLAVLCGGSEVQQQAAMLGLERELWSNALFDELLPRLCAELAPSVPYVPSSPSGGDLPFQVDRGVGHYYGVGAYLRPLDDARRADVRFASECLAFANVPSSEAIERFMRDLEPPFHHPRWKQRVPRDRGASWDFEDVRDHYIERLFAVDARTLRYADMERYLALGHAAVGETMLSTFAEWRRPGSRCRGGLVFWLKDLWDGAGWGVLDARSQPKSAYYYLKRAFAPLGLALTDEGVNGLALHVLNDAAEPVEGVLRLALYRDGETLVGEGAESIALAPHTSASFRGDALLGRFADLTYAYRFGPPNHDLIVASLTVGGQVRRAFHFPLGHARALEHELGLSARLSARDGALGVTVSTRRFAQCVSLDVRGYLASDDFFHLEPGGERFVALTPQQANAGPPRGSVAALNLRGHVQIASDVKA